MVKPLPTELPTARMYLLALLLSNPPLSRVKELQSVFACAPVQHETAISPDPSLAPPRQLELKATGALQSPWGLPYGGC
eukprot:9870717-Alexandrium_andersonii.AAC.1